MIDMKHGVTYSSSRANSLLIEDVRGDSCIMLLGHYDTVPGKLRVSVRKGTVSGRGAVDAKGPLAAMLVAASLSERPVRVAAVVGEEGDSRGVRELLKGGCPLT
jgi:LysW-gamma-L-lysine carboxypeptidase